ncbi:InlB B-repeat-containing protein [uncultured Eubacterium sp.]|uniref:InlB B-repeat-containing protein n=1 Tax=uncultured Eubacterium sp. TaxID=165185 RepID=UPI0025DA861E|nr:InlB B-repeat-containing protein [uncultured Eubacterium sp.]
MKGKNQKVKRKAVTKLRCALIMLLVAVFSISGIICVNAATIKDDGKYSLVLECNAMSEGTIDGDTAKIVKFDVADGEDSVSIAQLTKGIVPFDGEHEFSHWSTDFSDTSKADDEIPISNFTSSGNLYLNDGTEVKFNNGFFLYGVFSDKPLKDTGTYYLNLDAFGGTVKDKSVYQITSKSNEFKTVDLTKYEPERKGFTFKGWDLNGKYVNKITAADFADRDSVTVIATYTANEGFDDSKIHVTLDANGGTIDGKKSAKYNYLGGGNSGTSLSLLPYVPTRSGYTFNGWNSKKDSSGKNYKYLYWREWDKENWDNDRESEFERDGLITEDSGYERYLNLTLYATWTKDASTPDDTVKVIESNDGIKGSIEFADGIDSNCKLIINNVNVNKDLADKNVKFIADINVLKDNDIVQISGTKMKIRIALPEELKGYNTYSVVYILNDEIKETIPATLQNGYIVFETTHLSEYGIIATNTNSTPGNSEDNSNKNGDKKTKAENDKSTSNATDTKSTSPKTGSEGMLILLLAILLISGGTVTELLILSGKKREKNRK